MGWHESTELQYHPVIPKATVALGVGVKIFTAVRGSRVHLFSIFFHNASTAGLSFEPSRAAKACLLRELLRDKDPFVLPLVASVLGKLPDSDR